MCDAHNGTLSAYAYGWRQRDPPTSSIRPSILRAKQHSAYAADESTSLSLYPTNGLLIHLTSGVMLCDSWLTCTLMGVDAVCSTLASVCKSNVLCLSTLVSLYVRTYRLYTSGTSANCLPIRILGSNTLYTMYLPVYVM